MGGCYSKKKIYIYSSLCIWLLLFVGGGPQVSEQDRGLQGLSSLVWSLPDQPFTPTWKIIMAQGTKTAVDQCKPTVLTPGQKFLYHTPIQTSIGYRQMMKNQILRNRMQEFNYPLPLHINGKTKVQERTFPKLCMKLVKNRAVHFRRVTLPCIAAIHLWVKIDMQATLGVPRRIGGTYCRVLKACISKRGQVPI